MIARQHLRPPLWACVATALGCAALSALGVWQLQRGLAKRELQAQYLAAASQARLPLRADSAPPAHGVRAAQARGVYLADKQLLLDNQTLAQRPGYHAWTPLRLSAGGLLLVNRGWIARDAIPATSALPTGEIEVRGRWRALPRPGLTLAAPPCAPAQRFPAVLNYPSADELRCALGETVADGELLLDPDQPGGYVRNWLPAQEFTPSRHYAYAAQWFALAVTLLVLVLKLNLKRPND